MNPKHDRRKALEKQIAELDAANRALHDEIKTRIAQQTANGKRMNDLRSQLKQIGNISEPTVSDHAVLRYLERVELVQPAEARKRILCPGVLRALETLSPGNGEFPIDGGGIAVMKDNKVITVKI